LEGGLEVEGRLTISGLDTAASSRSSSFMDLLLDFWHCVSLKEDRLWVWVWSSAYGCVLTWTSNRWKGVCWVTEGMGHEGLWA
jgi:hypothetical protein